MFDPEQEPTDSGPEGADRETVDVNALTDADDPAATRRAAGDPTDVAEERVPQRPAGPAAHARPERIGRYRVEQRLGQGGFGAVYLAHDEQLDRRVAVKVPHARLVGSEEDAGPYLAEARAVAQLDHPNIVPVYDVGSAPRFPCYIVSKYVEGETLAARIRKDRPGWFEAAALVATIAEALDHAHERGLVHRDVKPGNILIDGRDVPYVVDFGLALRDAEQGLGPRYVGTPAYMSPEQAWGEGHRVDRRSDIFSLGVVFYELLCGVRPFAGPTREAYMIQMTVEEPRPPCNVDGSIPAELQRICLKALARRASDRYPTALALTRDLRLFLAEQEAAAGDAGAAGRPEMSGQQRGDTGYYLSRTLRVVPKGLRSFNERDAGFFVELLPGPRDREGLPESLRFWKDWIERAETGSTAAIGLIYGPSGCGKTSLVKAGLIPRLSRHVLAVYVEATPEETETRLLLSLRKRCPTLPGNLDLRDSLAALRRGQGLPSGAKVLLVLDQFEQWLHARRGEESPQLVQDLRQCDGEHVQCLVMVRDDFWMAATRFLRGLEVALLEGRNAAAVDLFEPGHARRVLAAFGRAYGKLDDAPNTARERDAFLTEAVRGLTQQGKVVCVRLALFAEMMKSRTWTRAELLQVGGARGVGFTFLEENFGSVSSPPAHVHHQQAARAVLGALLPESGTDIKGHMRSEAQLLHCSGYQDSPAEFEELIRILDAELRLITPTDPEGLEGDVSETSRRGGPPRQGHRYYQLTHDYLVHPLSAWLTRKQRESRQGRAVLCLQERANLWGPKPEVRFLPSIGEWLNIRLSTDRRSWSETQREMMRRAGWRYGLFSALAAALLTLMALGAREARSYFLAQGLVGSLRTATTSQVPAILDQLASVRPWAGPQLRSLLERTRPESQAHLHASLALIEDDPSQVDYLTDRLLASSPADLIVIRDALAPHRDRVAPRLWAALESAAPGDARILPSAGALAGYAAGDPRWPGRAGKVAQQLAGIPPVELGGWSRVLRPIRAVLVGPLSAIFRDPGRPSSERILATNVLADYASDRPEAIAGLLMDAEPEAFSTLFPVADRSAPGVLPALLAELNRRVEVSGDGHEAALEEARDLLARRQARAAIALIRIGHEADALPLLVLGADPRVRSYVALWLRPYGANPQVLADRLDAPIAGVARSGAAAPTMESMLFDPVASTRRAILLALGQYDPITLPPELRSSLLDRLRSIYRDDPDPGIHGAAAWTLRRWGQEEILGQLDREVAARGRRKGDLWFTNSVGITLSVVEGPVEFMMGSKPSEPGHEPIERLHRRIIPRRFALGTTEVTLAQYRRFLEEGGAAKFPGRRFNADPAGPVGSPSWYEAAAYCDWLSRKEDLQPCYETGSGGQYGPGMKIPAHARTRSGYRLPTEAEWEYACRAGTSTRCYYGSNRSLLDRYAWFNMNADGRAHPSARLLPNDLGLFDMLGNVDEWCEDLQAEYHPGPDDRVVDRAAGPSVLDKDATYILRGGYFGDVADHLNASHRIWNTPHQQLGAYGFRIARTIP